MKIRIIISFLVILSLPGWGEKLGELPQVMRPNMFGISKGEVFVVDGSKVLVYALNNLEFLRRFGKEGEGPGELRKVPFRWNMLHLTDDTVFIDGYAEIIEFSREGKLLREKKKPYKHFVIRPMGDHLITLRRNVDRGKVFFAVTICDKNFTELKELHQFQFKPTFFSDSLNYWAADNKIFVEKSDQDFLIEIYDFEGKSLKKIHKEFKKRSVKSPDKEWAKNVLKNDPETKAIGNWDRMNKEFAFPAYFPFIREITAGEGKIFLQTFLRKGRKIEYIIMDLKGKILKKVFLPEGVPVSVDDELTGRINRFYTFKGDFYYYMLENEDTETWELHRINWKRLN